MLSPKRTKFRKYQKGRTKGIKPNQTDLQFGKYGLKSLEVESRNFKRIGRIWIRVFPDLPITNKPAEVRMGKGKGYWVLSIQIQKWTGSLFNWQRQKTEFISLK